MGTWGLAVLCLLSEGSSQSYIMLVAGVMGNTCTWQKILRISKGSAEEK
jgi:nicotinamide riboside transporter PnuC